MWPLGFHHRAAFVNPKPSNAEQPRGKTQRAPELLLQWSDRFRGHPIRRHLSCGRLLWARINLRESDAFLQEKRASLELS